MSAINFTQAAADECVDAVEIIPVVNTNVIENGTFTDATLSSSATSCTDIAVQDVWYKFTAISSRTRIEVAVNVNATSIGFSLYKGSCETPALACVNTFNVSNFFADSEGKTFTDLEVGETYYVRVINFTSENQTHDFTVKINSMTPPENDLCDNATTLTPSLTFQGTQGTFANSSLGNNPAPNCYSSYYSQDVWYEFTALDGNATIEVKDGSIRTTIQLFGSDCSSTSIACAYGNSNGTNTKLVATNLVVGNTYKFRVVNSSSTISSATFNVGVTYVPTAVNDLIENAIVLNPNANCQNILGTFSGATLTGESPSCFSSSTQDVWYTFTATQEMMRIVVGGTSDLNHGFELYSGIGANNLITCINQVGLHISEIYTSNEYVIGQSYTIRVFNAGMSESVANFNICVMEFLAPSNDDCSNATLITPNLECEPVTGTFAGATVPNYATCSTASQDVWYKFIATEPEMSITLNGPEGLDHGFKVYAQACGGTEITCVNEGAMGLEETAVLTELTIGTIYFIQVYNVTTMNTGEFELCLIGSPTETCPSIVEISAPATICENTEVVFTSSIVNGGDAPMFQWLLNGNNVGDNNSTLTLTSVNNNDVVQLVIISNATCAPTNAMAFSNEITIATTATVTPTFDLPTSICVDAAFVLPTTSVNNIAGTWSPAFNNQATTTYTFTSTAACTAETTATIEVVALDGTVTVQNKVLNVQSNGTSFQWIDCATDLPIDGATAASFAPATPGSFAVIVTKNDCEWTSECFSVDNLSIEKVANTFSISPNPFTTAIQVTSEEVNAIYSVVNTTGQTVKTGVLEGTTTTVELSELETGYYFITIGQQTTKLIKH